MLELIGFTASMKAIVGMAWILIAVAYNYYYNVVEERVK